MHFSSKLLSHNGKAAAAMLVATDLHMRVILYAYNFNKDIET